MAPQRWVVDGPGHFEGFEVVDACTEQSHGASAHIGRAVRRRTESGSFVASHEWFRMVVTTAL
jgi:hypothetical protein